MPQPSTTRTDTYVRLLELIRDMRTAARPRLAVSVRGQLAHPGRKRPVSAI